jgi:hypothetical protein
MNFSEPFVRRPVATTLLTIGLALAGALAFRLLPVAPLPQVDYPTIFVGVSLPGASPETMAATVATPLERTLGRIAGVTEITSSSSLGNTRLTLQFDLDRDIDGAARDEMIGVDIRICRDSEPFAIGDLELTPYTVPHDAREPVQYLASDGRRKLGVLTDVGHSTPHLLAALGGCDALLLEFNHDSEMLARSAYPAWLKARIAGPLGHLSNAAAAEILAALDKRRLRTLVAAHLSQKNNTGQLALESIAGVIGREGIEVVVAEQEHGFDWIPC